MGTYCYVPVCTLQARSVGRRPQREDRGGAYCGGRRLQFVLFCFLIVAFDGNDIVINSPSKL